MHADQVDVGPADVAGLIAAQFPQWRDRPVRPVTSHGTVNALFRLGDDLVARFPLRPGAASDRRDELAHEQGQARWLAAHLPLAVPEPLALGAPGAGYDGWWAVYRWIPGETASQHTVGDPGAFARELAGFVTALHAVDTGGRTWNGVTRGGPLAAQDDDVQRALAQSTHLLDTVRLAGIWAQCRDADPAPADVWIHADLMPGNLLVRDGRLVAVIDLETVCVGDPAFDLMPAWNLLPAAARDVYRQALGVDDAAWARGIGSAIVQAIVALPYYVDTNPVMAATARHTLTAILG
ncbi:aminoglycoside phosphotransferase family protein [Actinoplanes auranticolor]|uniref:Phosphotransferase n=1 Tax=Actinoplanes auranticolor TaxID=47988 RepID=A0A919VUR4_9ACTN|nr:aminoglycoside phosphotransferase family protein [Actinoplanes auranticolor]GIM77456.1 phosphotransferase [Actinoplanes auranticolor]